MQILPDPPAFTGGNLCDFLGELRRGQVGKGVERETIRCGILPDFNIPSRSVQAEERTAKNRLVGILRAGNDDLDIRPGKQIGQVQSEQVPLRVAESFGNP